VTVATALRSARPEQEARSGISFGRLASVDPLAGSNEGLGDVGPRPPLEALEQIQFVR
jgi:endonuclease G, mitochondrial